MIQIKNDYLFLFTILNFLFRLPFTLRHVMDNFERDELDDSEEDIVTDYSQMNIPTNDINNIDSTDFVLRTMPSSTLVPTISVTPHSSASRNYPVLGIILNDLYFKFNIFSSCLINIKFLYFCRR